MGQTPRCGWRAAVQNGWSVSQMRQERGETLGTLDAAAGRRWDVVSSELDEDFDAAAGDDCGPRGLRVRMPSVQSGPRDEGPDFGEDKRAGSDQGTAASRSGI